MFRFKNKNSCVADRHTINCTLIFMLIIIPLLNRPKMSFSTPNEVKFIPASKVTLKLKKFCPKST